MLHRPNISACDHCGECCKSPCLLGGMSDVRRISSVIHARIGHIIYRYLRIERTPSGRVVVRPRRQSNGYCVFHVDNRCAIHAVKPRGGREFECWNKSTFYPESRYHWRSTDVSKAEQKLREIGVVIKRAVPKNMETRHA